MIGIDGRIGSPSLWNPVLEKSIVKVQKVRSREIVDRTRIANLGGRIVGEGERIK
jgi:hypothetical protein